MRKHTTESVSEDMSKFGYELLSEYSGAQEDITIKCPRGHITTMPFRSFYYNNARCKECHYENTRTPIEEIKRYLNEYGYKLLSKEVSGERDVVEVLCPFGVINHFPFRYFKTANMRCKCSSCASHKHDDKLEDVKSFLSEMGYSLISTSYKDCDHKLDMICDKGHKISMRWSQIRRGDICFKCSRMSRRMKYNDIKKYIENEGYTLLSDKYENAINILNMICPNGHEYNANWNSFNRGHRCKKCHDEVYRGEHHHFWNPEKSNEERKIGRNYDGYNKWRYTVYIRDHRTCQRCGYKGKNINAHHKDGYSWCKERRTDVSNGVTLCKKCHSLFHHIYGSKNNTEQQFEEFMLNYKIVDDAS